MVPIAQASAHSVTVPLGAIHVTALASMEGAEEAMQITDPAQPEIKEPTPAPAPIPELPPNPLLVKVTECWAAVTAANQASFPAWTELITSAEKLVRVWQRVLHALCCQDESDVLLWAIVVAGPVRPPARCL